MVKKEGTILVLEDPLMDEGGVLSAMMNRQVRGLEPVSVPTAEEVIATIERDPKSVAAVVCPASIPGAGRKSSGRILKTAKESGSNINIFMVGGAVEGIPDGAQRPESDLGCKLVVSGKDVANWVYEKL